jgi:hypothetical protein
MKKSVVAAIAVITLLVGTIFGYSFSTNAQQANTITTQEVEQAQNKWKEGLISLGKMKKDNKSQAEITAAADTFITEVYDYQNNDVEFKPTKASDKEFRLTKDEAISYFVTGSVEEDHGFATANPFKEVKFENARVISKANTATAMGNYFFTDYENKTTKVDYTFEYIKNNDGKVKIIVHHSSLPFEKPSHQE